MNASTRKMVDEQWRRITPIGYCFAKSRFQVPAHVWTGTGDRGRCVHCGIELERTWFEGKPMIVPAPLLLALRDC